MLEAFDADAFTRRGVGEPLPYRVELLGEHVDLELSARRYRRPWNAPSVRAVTRFVDRARRAGHAARARHAVGQAQRHDARHVREPGQFDGTPASSPRAAVHPTALGDHRVLAHQRARASRPTPTPCSSGSRTARSTRSLCSRRISARCSPASSGSIRPVWSRFRSGSTPTSSDRARSVELPCDVLAVGRDRGRDWRTFFDAVRNTDLRVRVVCRPALLAGLDVPANVEVVGVVDRASYRELLASAAVVAVITETLPYPTGQSVLLEAMAMGRCCVVTAHSRVVGVRGRRGRRAGCRARRHRRGARAHCCAPPAMPRSARGSARLRASPSPRTYTAEAMWSSIAELIEDELVTDQVAAVVWTYNRYAVLEETLRSVCTQDRRPDLVVVVDNHSVDGTRELVREHFPEVVVHDTGTNAGVGGAAAAGISEALARGADWIWLVEDDTPYPPDALGNGLGRGGGDLGRRTARHPRLTGCAARPRAPQAVRRATGHHGRGRQRAARRNVAPPHDGRDRRTASRRLLHDDRRHRVRATRVAARHRRALLLADGRHPAPAHVAHDPDLARRTTRPATTLVWQSSCGHRRWCSASRCVSVVSSSGARRVGDAVPRRLACGCAGSADASTRSDGSHGRTRLTPSISPDRARARRTAASGERSPQW